MAYGYYLMGLWMPKGQSFLMALRVVNPKFRKG